MKVEQKKQLLKDKAKAELTSILKYWLENTIDEENGGFVGEINHQNVINNNSEKGAVLNARILWSFSAAYAVEKNPEYLSTAKRAFQYIKDYFFDKEFGGIFWSLNADGSPKDTKNQIYAIAFVIYGLSEFYKVFKNEDALELAQSLFYKIELYSKDYKNKGYLEAFTRDWQEIEDLRLSEKDANEKKTMNTHLHIVEAYANLYTIWPNQKLKDAIKEILEVIAIYFIDKNSWHLKLFFDENWKEKEDVISYGHDIEAAWLLQWCAETIEDVDLVKSYQKFAVEFAKSTKEGIDKDGGLWYEYEPKKQELIAEKHWWPQAELWIGMINAWQLTQNEEFLDITEKNFEFVEKYIIDLKKGEWIWGVYADYSPILKDKAGFWKCPYHNSRACIELIKRL
ncbi:cellobiose 2-epimerase [Cloacibacterium rupense]|uniref:Cellobiose 2-epimerase n=1 Tax=Cloacibacterium rupense TaxID=517423 RepID=A0ABQ2NIC9_9FLAO|nr:AGE family epimerase/isomerase [Cloacibacterium rupense]GGP01994.1 cellobiose 2-epimerase [Cloacibacterium rupense]